jgi:hypothetical protein
MSKPKNIILLSEKSSGSSAFQEILTSFTDAKHVSKTRHFVYETLYWTKAASVLQMPQIQMVDSEVPIERNKARLDIIQLLQENLPDFEPDLYNDDRNLIMEGWRSLCRQFSPIFFEKSPHHLCQWSAIELILDCIKSLNDIDFLVVGLVRNPMDTIYSQYKRWKSLPEATEEQWVVAYKNLLELKEILGDKLIVFRYEDITKSADYFKPIFSFCDIKNNVISDDFLHSKSIQKWKSDHLYGFTLSKYTKQLAAEYGYTDEVLSNDGHIFWPVVKHVSRKSYQIAMPVKKLARERLSVGYKILRNLG